MSSNGWTDKEYMIYIYKRILLSHKKWNLAICYSMDRPSGYYATCSKSDRERQIPYDFTYMWNLKNETNKMKTDS